MGLVTQMYYQIITIVYLEKESKWLAELNCQGLDIKWLMSIWKDRIFRLSGNFKYASIIGYLGVPIIKDAVCFRQNTKGYV